MTSEIISAMTSVFDGIFTWLLTAIQSIIPIFWSAGSGSNPGHLTFLGVLALIALGVSIFFLIVGLIQNFLHLRG